MRSLLWPHCKPTTPFIQFNFTLSLVLLLKILSINFLYVTLFPGNLIQDIRHLRNIEENKCAKILGTNTHVYDKPKGMLLKFLHSTEVFSIQYGCIKHSVFICHTICYWERNKSKMALDCKPQDKYIKLMKEHWFKLRLKSSQITTKLMIKSLQMCSTCENAMWLWRMWDDTSLSLQDILPKILYASVDF